MSRYAINEPDPDQYEAKPVDDIDVPDFDAPDVPAPGTYAVVGGGPGYAAVTTDPPLDPAEHALHDAFDALGTISAELLRATDVERVMQLRTMARQLWTAVTAICDCAAARCDEDLERRR